MRSHGMQNAYSLAYEEVFMKNKSEHKGSKKEVSEKRSLALPANKRILTAEGLKRKEKKQKVK